MSEEPDAGAIRAQTRCGARVAFGPAYSGLTPAAFLLQRRGEGTICEGAGRRGWRDRVSLLFGVEFTRAWTEA